MLGLNSNLQNLYCEASALISLEIFLEYLVLGAEIPRHVLRVIIS